MYVLMLPKHLYYSNDVEIRIEASRVLAILIKRGLQPVPPSLICPLLKKIEAIIQPFVHFKT